jgi:hypothetical protein
MIVSQLLFPVISIIAQWALVTLVELCMGSITWISIHQGQPGTGIIELPIWHYSLE